MPGKSNYSDDYKRRVIIAFRNRGDRSADDVAQEFGVSPGAIYYWMKGEPVARAAVLPRDKYPLAFKRKAVAALRNRGTRSTEEIAASLGVARSQLYRWRDRFNDLPDDDSADEEPNERTGYTLQRRRDDAPVARQEGVERKPSATQAAAENRQLTALRAERERLAAEAAALRKTIVLLGRGH